ncbi:adherens junction-associated protein 1 [Passer montanus]|uniref:adherens junction-associated protein 1 n=1 Tax=Passer montanus TaxID=9160 RepID=UPI00195FAEFB|nr:adherens junction-associated protein 1 [Passer montanus]
MPCDAILGDSGWRTREDNDTRGAGGCFGWLGSEIQGLPYRDGERGCPTALLTPSPSVHRSGCPLGSHAWILIAMFHLAMDLASCQPPATTGTAGKLSPRPALRHRLSRGSLWGAGEELQRPGPPWTCGPAPPLQRPRSRRPPPAAPLPRGRRHLRGRGFAPRDGRPTALPEVIVWGPTGEEDSLESSTLPGAFATTTTATATAAATTPATTAAAATSATAATPPRVPASTAAPVPGGDGPRGSPGRGSTAEPAAGHSSGGKDARPPRGLGDSTGLAVHQIITITVSLIMVIAALITTLVLKNCCAQSGRPRRNSHQRKLDQQEESCQNLTDFAPARVPSALDIFTAYNETLQCSHECVRTPVPVYAEDTLHSPGDYKTTFNGNRPSSSDRHLIPVAFVSEKWFEISC